MKVRYGDFTTLTRQIIVQEPLTEANDIYRLGCWLLGLGVSSLREPSAQQLVLL